MARFIYSFAPGLAAVAAAVALSLAPGGIGTTPAVADGKIYPPVKDPVVAKECGACHMKFSAAFLRAGTWKRMVDGLQDHFGENASLDPVVAAQVLAYLTANAEPEPSGLAKLARKVMPAGPVAEQPLRISEQPWFKDEHPPRRISAANLKRKNARSVSDCLACHKGADVTGNFDD